MDEIQGSAYYYGDFAADIILNGFIHPDMKKSNIGFRDNKMKFIDFAEMTEIKIPEQLTAETLRRLSRTIFPLFDDFQDYKSKSCLRAGFTARGGILADIILRECMKMGFGSLMFLEDSINMPSANFDAIEYISRPNIEQALREWMDFSIKEAVETILHSPSFNKYYLERYYYNCSFMNIPDDKYPVFLAKAGLCAFKYGRKYRAYGLLKKALILLNWMEPLYKICKENLNATIHLKKLKPELKAFIDSHIDMDYFELTWILDDFDLVSY